MIQIKEWRVLNSHPKFTIPSLSWNNSTKKGPWQWDKSTVIKEGADFPSSFGKKSSMSRCWGGGSVLELVCTSEALTEHPELPVGAGAWQPHGSIWALRNQNCPLAWLDLCFGSCSHCFRKWVEMKFNINSPANCRTSRGRTAKPGGKQEKGPASNPRATPGLQLPGQTGHHSRASAAKYFSSNRFCMYRSAEKWHPDDQGRKLLPIKMWLLDWFVFFYSPLVCRTGWINDQFILVNLLFLFCLLPLQDKLLLGSQEFLNLRKMLFSLGFWTNLWQSLLCDMQAYMADYRLVPETTCWKQTQKWAWQWVCHWTQVPQQLGLAQNLAVF